MSLGAIATLPSQGDRRRWRTWPLALEPTTVCFFTFALLYLAAAGYVSFAGNTAAIGNDGVARVAIANRILWSRDPHLAAIGFEWGPLPVLALLPLAALKPLVPILVTHALAGNITSALFMAGAVSQLLGLLGELGVRRLLCWVLTLGFALHPEIVLYAANAMSEAAFIFFLLVVGRQLHRWLRTQRIGALVATGFYLALAYLTRYESGAAAAAVAVLVGAATFAATRGTLGQRLRQGLVDSMIVAAPFGVAFVGWAAISWVITGMPFQQLSSIYARQRFYEQRAVGRHATLGQLAGAVVHAGQWILALEPFLPVVLLACLVVVARRRDWTALAVPATLGAVVAFMMWAFVTGKVDLELRYFIVTIPLTAVLAGVAVAPGWRPAAAAGGVPSPSPPGAARATAGSVLARLLARVTRHSQGVAAATVVVLTGASIPVAVHSVLDPSVNVTEAYAVQALVTPGRLDRWQRRASLRDRVDYRVSAYIDSLHLGRGTVLVDDFLGFVIVMASRNPPQYVITSDSDFEEVLADPYGNGVKYVLVPSETGSGIGYLDAVNRAYPDAYATGRGIGTLVKQFIDPSDKSQSWRLYRVTRNG